MEYLSLIIKIVMEHIHIQDFNLTKTLTPLIEQVKMEDKNTQYSEKYKLEKGCIKGGFHPIKQLN